MVKSPKEVIEAYNQNTDVVVIWRRYTYFVMMIFLQKSPVRISGYYS